MSDISEETHEFRQGKNSCLYSTVQFLLQLKNAIDNRRLDELVKEKITRINKSSRRDLCNATDENNKITKKTSSRIKNMKTTDNENELKALVLLCRVIFCMVCIRKNGRVTSSVNVRYYGEDFSAFQECVYIIYDEIHKTYSPLYLINKSNADESRTVFVRKDNMINILLRKFFKDHLKYDEFVPLDDQIDTMVSEVFYQVQNESDDIPGIIALNTEKNTTKKQTTTKAAECLIMSNSTMSTSNTNADAQLLSNTKTKISNTTHEFRRIIVPADGSCLYWSFINVFGKSRKINVKDLRNKAADYICDMDIEDVVLLSDTGCRNRAQLSDKIRKNDWAGEAVLLALSEMHSVVISVVNKVINEQGRLSVNLINYGESNQSFEKCVYIIYDRPASHYEPLYLFDKNNPNEYITIFDRYDPVVNNLLEDFIGKQRHCDGYGTLDDVRICCQDDISNKSIDDPHSTTSNVNINILQEPTISDNHQLPPIKTTTSNETYEFRIGELPGDDLCLFSCAIYSFDRSQTINIKSLRKKVANHIREWKEIDDIHLLSGTGCQTREEYCRKIEEGTICGSEPERRALAYLYPNILFCLISKMIYDENESSVHIDTYVKDISLYTRCVVIVYDVAANNYLPLYLYDKIKQEEKKTNFKYDDKVTKLLGEFIRKTFNYYDYINFDSQSTSDEVDSPSHVESEFIDVFEKIAVDATTNILKIAESEKHKQHDNCTSAETSRYKLQTTQKLAKKSVASDGHCLFSSFCFLLCELGKNAVKDLRKKVAGFILQSDIINDEVLYAETGKTRKQYCDDIQNTNQWGGEAEIRAISKLYGVIVCIVNVNEVHSTISSVRVTEFPENESSFEKCVYILYVRSSHYEPLYLCNGNNSNKNITIFNRNDETVKNLLREFIQDKFHYHGSIEFNNKTNGGVFEVRSNRKDEFVTKLNSSDKNVKKTLSKKRKTPEDDESPFMADTTKKLTTSTSCANEANIQSLTSSRSIPSNDQIYAQHEMNDGPGSIERLLQMDISRFPDFFNIQPMEQQQIAVSSSILLAQTHEIKFEKEIIPGFCGRYLSDYEPANEYRRNGTKSKPRKPSYFADLANNHCLNLLIPTMFLLADRHPVYAVCTEIALVTEMIKGCIYFHPSFKFYFPPGVGKKSSTCNPFYIYDGYDKKYKLEDYAEGIKRILLYLPVIMLTDKELLKNQPLEHFPSLRSNGEKDETIYDKLDTFKVTFRLNNVCFAVTLWIKNVRDGAYHRRIDRQYISQASTHNKKFSVTKYLARIANEPSTTIPI